MYIQEVCNICNTLDEAIVKCNELARKDIDDYHSWCIYKHDLVSMKDDILYSTIKYKAEGNSCEGCIYYYPEASNLYKNDIWCRLPQFDFDGKKIGKRCDNYEKSI